MWETLKRIRELPPETEVYCSHEYSERNYKMARRIDRENQGIRARGEQIRKNNAAGRNISVPFPLGEAIALNPFLRADDPEMARVLEMEEDAGPVEVFAELRRRYDDS